LATACFTKFYFILLFGPASFLGPVMTCMPFLRWDGTAAVREAAMSSFQEFAGKGGLPGKADRAGSSRPKSGKGGGAPGKAASGQGGRFTRVKTFRGLPAFGPLKFAVRGESGVASHVTAMAIFRC
jgi:hypothetical protein